MYNPFKHTIKSSTIADTPVIRCPDCGGDGWDADCGGVHDCVKCNGTGSLSGHNIRTKNLWDDAISLHTALTELRMEYDGSKFWKGCQCSSCRGLKEPK